MNIHDICNAIVLQQRQRRFAIKMQSKMDRSLESYVRVYYTDWRPDAPEDERAAENKKALAIVKAARAGTHGDVELVTMAQETAASRAVWDNFRDKREEHMEALARALSVWPWCQTIKGFAGDGKFLAIIVAETTSPSAPESIGSYTKGLDGIYSRLGLAPYAGHAGSTWKRETWRPRALTAVEWTAHPFSGARYAEMFVIADVMLRNPSNPYRPVYLARRAHTAVTHPDWTKMHSHRDAQRVALKSLIAGLHREWMQVTPNAADGATTTTPARAGSQSPQSAAA